MKRIIGALLLGYILIGAAACEDQSSLEGRVASLELQVETLTKASIENSNSIIQLSEASKENSNSITILAKKGY